MNCLIRDAKTQPANTRRCSGTFWAVTSLLLGKGFIYARDAEAQTETKTDSMPQTSSKKTPAATNQNVETIYPFKFGWWVETQGGVTRCFPVSPPCSWCFQPLILTADANSLKNVPTKHLHFKQIDKGHFEKLPPHDCSVRWHVPCVPALLTT